MFILQKEFITKKKLKKTTILSLYLRR